MNKDTHKEMEYTKPVCKVYSINLESVIAISGDQVDPTPEEGWGEF